MFQTVISVCDSHQTIWESNTAFSTTLTAFRTKVDELKGMINVQINSSKGATALKKIKLEAVVEKALTLSNVLGAYAQSSNNTELLFRNLYTRSEWMRGNSVLRIEHLKRLKEDVNAHLASLATYGLAQTDVDEFVTLIATYEELVKLPRMAIIDHKNTTKYIGELFTECDLILNGQLDRILLVFQASAPKFVSVYSDARIIIDSKGKRNKFEKPNAPLEEEDDADPGFAGAF